MLPSLLSLRSFWARPAADTQGRSAAAATAAHGGRPFSAASGLVRQSAAAEPAAAEQQQQEEETLEQIQSRIFGNHIGNGLRSGRKVLRRALVGPRLVAYYPPDPLKSDPLMLNIKAESAKLKLDRLRRRGKAPPKKGAGKRSGKKKR
ncbi:hypothetical protein D9Q98_001538 [Chlorella vulgaris]|uniref:Small ribosomal subunit protein mS33 n=1 Tax=Chlorella vulgaris TaxID=3077 RepID=A0A9D4U0C1_CHLVU|nr:hypothetical protein D9Q98_001538 [Chlorella vulgaris]